MTKYITIFECSRHLCLFLAFCFWCRGYTFECRKRRKSIGTSPPPMPSRAWGIMKRSANSVLRWLSLLNNIKWTMMRSSFSLRLIIPLHFIRWSWMEINWPWVYTWRSVFFLCKPTWPPALSSRVLWWILTKASLELCADCREDYLRHRSAATRRY